MCDAEAATAQGALGAIGNGGDDQGGTDIGGEGIGDETVGPSKENQHATKTTTEPERLRFPPIGRGGALSEQNVKSPARPPAGAKPAPIPLPETPAKTITSWDQVDRVRGALSTDLIFQVKGKYPSIRRALKALDWTENPDQDSPIFHLLWAFKEAQIPYQKLEPFQIVNHFQRIGELTTKIGLTRNMKAIQEIDKVPVDSFFPKCFDLTVPEGMAAFLDEHTYVTAECIVKKVATGGKVPSRLISEAALVVCTERFWPTPEPPSRAAKPAPKKKKWLLDLATGGKPEPAPPKPPVWNPYQTALVEFRRLMQEHTPATAKEVIEEDPPLGENGEVYGAPRPGLVRRAQALRDRLIEVAPQTAINGVKNAWIIKNARLSRGRGIQVLSSIEKIIAHCRKGKFDCIAQKYIENPMLLKGKKFDIRQWALVTDLDPLTVYVYKDSYLRLATSQFTMGDMDDKYIHLCNRSVQKNSENYTEDDMWPVSRFAEQIRASHGTADCPDPWGTIVYERIKQIIVSSARSVVGVVEPRKGCFELLGYDLMLDEHLNPWLIEVNSSPDMGNTHPVLAGMVPDMVRDTIAIVVAKNKALLASAGNADTAGIVSASTLNTGKWELAIKERQSQERVAKRVFMKQRLKTVTRASGAGSNLRDVIHQKMVSLGAPPPAVRRAVSTGTASPGQPAGRGPGRPSTTRAVPAGGKAVFR